ncbi:hypothetical protein [Parafrankia soli]|uniref:hypothetical protein n=1 Tax=Parafrankia soli TaxID=2599596 RepID=UPI001041EABD|nr:hypothetical protein [Parafrankia soli]
MRITAVGLAIPPTSTVTPFDVFLSPLWQVSWEDAVVLTLRVDVQPPSELKFPPSSTMTMCTVSFSMRVTWISVAPDVAGSAMSVGAVTWTSHSPSVHAFRSVPSFATGIVGDAEVGDGVDGPIEAGERVGEGECACAPASAPSEEHAADTAAISSKTARKLEGRICSCVCIR